MAEDTRDPDPPPSDDATSSQPRRPRRKRDKFDYPQSQASKMWEALGNPKEPVNMMPGGTYNSAGGKPKELSWRDALKFSEFNKEGRPAFYQTSCARDSLLVGIASGGAVGGLRFILTGLSSMLLTSNLAVGSFAVVSSGMYYWCEQRKRKEAQGIAAAMQGLKMLNEKKAREKAEAAEAEAALLMAEEEKKKKRNQKWYKLW